MKIFFVLFIICILSFSAVQLFAKKTQKNIESYPYTVLQTFEDFEIRSYDSSLFTTVKLDSEKYSEASSKGFSILAGYIFGGNNKNQKIAMTSPVVMTLEDSMTMMFMVPRELQENSLPKPNSSKIEFQRTSKKIVAAVSFGGWANDERIQKNKNKLIRALESESIAFTNRFCFLGYNAPYEVKDRLNEVIVELESWKQ